MNHFIFMRYSLIFISLFIFYSNFVHATKGLDIFEQDAIEKNSFSTTEGLLSTLIANHVSAVSGDFTDTATDCLMIGPESLSLERTYSSSPSIGLFGIEPVSLNPPDFPERGEKYCGWQLNHLTKLILQSDGGDRARHNEVKAFIPHRFFSQILHQKEVNNHNFDHGTYTLPTSIQRGMTNCSLGAISARTNPKNVKASFYRKHKSSDFFEFCKVVFGTGDVRYYHCHAEQRQRSSLLCIGHFKFVRERKANGNQIIVGKKKIIRACNSTDTTVFSWLQIQRASKKEFRVFTSHFPDPLIYRYSRCHRLKKQKAGDLKQRYYLTSLSRPDQPDESYEYTRNVAKDGMLLSRKNRPANRFLEIEYYKVSDQPGELFKLSLDDPLDPRCNRVKCLKAPVGHDATPIITHQFFYDLQFKTNAIKKTSSVYAGTTTVYDAYQRKTHYVFNDQHRLKAIVQCDQNDHRYLTTKYLWTSIKKKTHQENSSASLFNLMGKLVLDRNGTILIGRFFDYDEKGNILTERLYGNLTGKESAPIELNQHKKPKHNGVESYKRTFKYSNCQFNLLLEEKEDNGRIIRNTYVPNSDLIRSKFLFNGNRICIREFYEYDENNALLSYISDNGTGVDDNDFSNVTERHITRHTPRKTIPVGLPEQTDELVIDFSTGHEKLIKRTIQEYSLDGKLLRKHIYDASEAYRYTLEWEYDAHGNLLKEVNAIGQIIEKRYDENDNLIYQQGPSYNFYTTHHYDFSNRLIRTEEIHNSGERFTTSYRYDLVSNRIAQIDRYGNETHYVYDHLNRLVKTISPAIETNSGIVQPTATTSYDPLSNPILEADPRGCSTIQTFTIRGKPTSIRHPDGQTERLEYDLSGTLVKKISSNQTQTYFSTDCFGRVLKESVYSADGKFLYATAENYNSFHKTSSTDTTGVETLFSYNGEGKLIQTTCQDKVVRFEYDTLGRLIRKKEPYEEGKVKVTCTEYDLLNKVLEERIEDEQGVRFKKVSYLYDDLGNRTHVIEETAAGTSQHITYYNSDKKPIKMIDPEGNETHIGYHYAYRNHLDQFVLQTTTTDPLGRKIIITYDAMERPVNIKRFNPFGLLLEHQEMGYDATGNLISLIDHVIVGGEEIRTIETAFVYQETGLLTCLIEAKGHPEQRITRTAYNNAGQKTVIIKPDGLELRFSYDAQGRLKTCHSSDHTVSYLYHYNLRNQIIQVDDLVQGTTSELIYDEKGRLVNEFLSNGLPICYAYDLLDRVKRVVLPDEISIDYHYDPVNLKRIERIGQDGRLLYTHYYDDFDLAGLNLKARSIDGKERIYQYDKLKRPFAFKSASYKQEHLSYDHAGRLVSYHSVDPIGDVNTQLSYDDSDHLIEEHGFFNNIYTCDSLHNRLSKNQNIDNINVLNQLTYNGIKSFSYDHAGNLTSSQHDDKHTQYRYDANDRLVSIKSDEEIHYLYDAFNRRIAKIEKGQTTRYLYVGQDEIGSVDEVGNIQELRVLGQGHGAEIGATIAIELKNQIFVPQHDFRGNIVCLTNLSGQAVETYRYSIFGESSIFNANGESIASSAVGNQWRFASKRYDEESGFVNFGRRYYDPDNGRWITADPAGHVDGTNLYAYLHHNPTTTFDLYGLQEQQSQQQEEPYYPLQNVDHHDRSDQVNQPDDAAPNQEPLGFTATKSGKKTKMYYCGLSQLAELGIGFVNGIMNSLNDASTSANKLSEMAGNHFVTFLHNESRGFLVDMVRAFCELYFHTKTDSVVKLQKKWDAFFALASSSAVLYHICHSEGAIITRNALESYPEELRRRIIVVAIAPGAYIEQKYALKVTHYVSQRDVVPLFDFVGAYRCRETTVVLRPHPNAPWLDHSFDSPTYGPYRERSIKDYINTYGGNSCVLSS